MATPLHWAANALPTIWAALLFVVHLLTVARALTRPNRTPAARVAWVATIMLLPLAGPVAYWVLGETDIGRRRIERIRRAQAALQMPPQTAAPLAAPAASLFDLSRSINGFEPLAGNRVELLGDPAAAPSEPTLDCCAAMDRLIADVEQATQHVHIAVYIWLDDGIGTRLAHAVAAAARRGVSCRVMVDALGSRAFVRGPLWPMLADAGVRLRATLDDLTRVLHLPYSRLDLRDHRKMVVIDNRIGYCGSQNCADPAFRIKARFAPWIDVLLRLQGPVVRQLQWLFLGGWVAETGEGGLNGLAAIEPIERFADGCVAQVFETGPMTRYNAMSDMFVASMYAAQTELIVTTPYFVPDEAMLRALCAAPRRGIRTTVVFPERNDSWLVANASRSCFADLLSCGVDVRLYPLGLLHAKTLTCDGRLALVGSANMDRRSLQLNFENNLLIADPDVVGRIRARQLGYVSVSSSVSAQAVRAWPFHQRLMQNVVDMMSPVL